MVGGQVGEQGDREGQHREIMTDPRSSSPQGSHLIRSKIKKERGSF
jgi:hypothetical protein